MDQFGADQDDQFRFVSLAYAGLAEQRPEDGNVAENGTRIFVPAWSSCNNPAIASHCPAQVHRRGHRPAVQAGDALHGGSWLIVLNEGATASRMRSLSMMVGVKVNWVPKPRNWVLMPETPHPHRGRHRELAAGDETGRLAVERHQVRLGQDLRIAGGADGPQASDRSSGSSTELKPRRAPSGIQGRRRRC